MLLGTGGRRLDGFVHNIGVSVLITIESLMVHQHRGLEAQPNSVVGGWMGGWGKGVFVVALACVGISYNYCRRDDIGYLDTTISTLLAVDLAIQHS